MPPRKAPTDAEREIVAFLERLPLARIGVNNYTRVDRARDFIATFTESESGRRVFAQISAMCDPRTGPKEAENHGLLAFNAGKRYVLAEIMHALVVPQEEIDA